MTLHVRLVSTNGETIRDQTITKLPARVGRDPNAEIPIAEDPFPMVSAVHAEFNSTEAGITVTPRSQKNVTLLNGLLGVVLLHGNARMRDEVRAVGNEADAADSDVARSGTPSADPDGLFDAEAHPAFVEARDEIARGEYAAARQRIYALLAIIDRLEDPRREAVEAEAQFVLAQTLHLEALERMGTSR